MKDNEMVAALKRIRDVHTPFSVAWTALDSIVAELEARALEAEPLAVLFEGWISDNELGMTAKELASGYTYLRLSKNREQPTDHAVTFKIMPRKAESHADEC